MRTERLINVVLSDLALENLKLQDELEVAINNAETIDDKVKTIKEILGKIVQNESSIAKFQALITKPETTEENGKI